MFDMIVLVFEVDMICVVLFMFGNLVSNINYVFLDGVNEVYYEILYY